MTPFHIEGHGLVLAGHAETLGAARQAARKWLTAQGSTAFAAEQSAELARVEHAWWSATDVTFVGAEHETAEPVTVVHIPAPPAPNRSEA